MVITIDLSKSDLDRIHDTLGIDSYDDIHAVFKEDAKECYWRNKEIKNDNEINNKLTDYIISLGYEMKLREYIKRNDDE